jgi:hypothetical protein
MGRSFPAKAGTQSFRGCRWAPAFGFPSKSYFDGGPPGEQGA